MKIKPNAPQTSTETASSVSTSPSSTTSQQPLTLPLDGFSRAKQLLPFIGIGESTLWAWCKQGRFPKPIKLSSNISVWQNEKIHKWFKEQCEKGKACTPANDDDYNDFDGVA